MKSFSEEGLEACNKYIRRYREQLARKTYFEDNLRNTFAKVITYHYYKQGCQSNPINGNHRLAIVIFSIDWIIDWIFQYFVDWIIIDEFSSIFFDY